VSISVKLENVLPDVRQHSFHGTNFVGCLHAGIDGWVFWHSGSSRVTELVSLEWLSARNLFPHGCLTDDCDVIWCMLVAA